MRISDWISDVCYSDLPAGIVVAHDRPRALEGRRRRQTGAAQRSRPGRLTSWRIGIAARVEREGQPAAAALRVRDEGDGGPAGHAERPLALDQLAAAETARDRKSTRMNSSH